MIKKHSVLLGILISVALLLMATTVYPGGSITDKNQAGFSWSKNYISNLFTTKAVNGADNPSRFWADAGMIFLSVSMAVFFIDMSQKIPVKSAAAIIKYFGVLGMIATFLIVTPLHDSMIALSSTLFLVSIFYITVFVFKSKLRSFKLVCIVFLLIFYTTLYLYGFGKLEFLPFMQKLTFISTLLLVIGLFYFTKKADFEQLK